MLQSRPRSGVTPPTRPLTPAETTDLGNLERVIERGLEAFVEVGAALLEIRDGRLYLETHTSFEAYCRERWGFSRERGRQLIQAADVATIVGSDGPTNEAQAREMAPVLRDEGEEAVVEVWRELVAKHGDKLTAGKVREAVTDRLALEQRVGTLKSSLSVEYYTPAPYADAAREVLGEINLDPASCLEANKTVHAARIFTASDDGLAQDWRGSVWLNPPYGAACGQFVDKLLDSYQTGAVEAAVVLLNAYSTDVGWFKPLWDFTLCFTDHRIHFASPLRRTSAPTTGSVFVYLGPEIGRFAATFGQFGPVVARLEAAA